MYPSDFGITGFERDEGTWLPVQAIASGRYSLYKVRLNGMLHFVKTPSPEYRNDLITLESLRKEFTIAYPLNHPSIVRYLRFENSAIYEEYVEGRSIGELIESGDSRLRDSDFIDLTARSLFEALDYIHALGVTHLDIKPENLMITRIGNRLKIVDFSCAKSGSLDSTPGFTPEYMAPEQLEGETGVETDIYLAGETLRRMLEGSGDERRWKGFLRRATATNPKDRFHSAAEALKALPPRKGRRRVLLLSVAAFIIVAIITLSLLFYKPFSSSVPTQKETDTLFIAEPETEKIESEVLKDTPVPTSPPAASSDGTASSPSSPSSSAMPNTGTAPVSTSNIETMLANNIKRYVQGYYKRNVHPACQIPGYNENGAINYDRDTKIQAAISEASRKCNQYGNELISKHPDKADFITRYLWETMNNEQLHLGPIMEKSANVNKPIRERIQSDGNKSEWEKDIELSKISQ